jgi:hypothetical protein
MATALPRWVITAIVIFGVRMDMLRRVAICGGRCEQWRCKSECEDGAVMILHVSTGLQRRSDTAVVLQPAKDMRKKIVEKLLLYLPGDGPSLPMDVRPERFVNIGRVSYRSAETVYILGR